MLLELQVLTKSILICVPFHFGLISSKNMLKTVGIIGNFEKIKD
jgi:hypothetical protein